MASQNLNVGTSANSNDGDTLRGAFVKLKQMFAEVYGQTYSQQGDLSGTTFKIDQNRLQLTATGTASDDGKVLTYDHATQGFSWEDAFTGTIGDITGIVAGVGLTGSSLSSDEATLDVGAGTGITVTADEVSLASTVQDEITLNTAKTGITATQTSEIAANTLKDTDQTVVLTGGTNVTVTGTYPSFTIASDDVVGAVTSVNSAAGVVVLGTDDVSEGSTNLYDKTVTLTDAGNITIGGTYPDFTIASADVVGAVTSVNGADGVVVLDTADVAEDTNLYYTEARVAANSAVVLNTAKTGISTAQASEITANNSKTSNVTHTGAVTGNEALTITDLAVTTGKIADEAVDATKLDVSNTGAAGQVLQYNADGTMTWVTGVAGDITGVTAGDGLTGGGTGGDVTLNIVGGAGITAAADEISLSANVAGAGMTYVNGVLNVNTIGADGIVNDAIDGTKLAQFDDTLSAATTGHVLVSNGTDFIQAAMSGDATIVAGGAITIADDAIDATKLNVADNGSSGQLLKSDGDGSFSWVTALTGDVEAIVAGAGLTGTDLDGPTPTINVIGGDGITVTADAVSLDSAVAGDGLTLSSGVLSVDAIQTGDIADDAVTSDKLALFDDSLAATDTHMLVANGTDFFNKAMSGDATLANTGAITIADDAIDTDKILNDAVTADKLADSINTDIATGVAKVSNITTNLSITGDTDARTIVSSDGTDAIIPVATASVSGVMSKTIFDEHVINNGKAAGTATNLTMTASGSGFSINSSDGTDVDLTLASTSAWGLMSDEMFDAQVLNDAKVSNFTHTGDVTGNEALTIATNAVVTDKILDANVTTAKILDANITTAKILDANVTTAKIADNAVDAAKLNVSGNGASGQVLASDGDGSMTWTASGGGYSAIYASSAITSWTDKAVYVFTNTAALTHTLPSSPSVGTSFKMSLRSTHVNTLARNGSSIMGLAEDLVLDDLTASFEFFFAGGAQGWVIIGAN